MTISNDNQDNVRNQGKFSTRRFQLAIFIHASSKLEFLGCQPVGGGEVLFVFDDANDEADALQLAFESREKVSAIALFASQRFLRRKIAAALGEERLDGQERRAGRDGGNRKGNSQNRFGETYDNRYTSR